MYHELARLRLSIIWTYFSFARAGWWLLIRDAFSAVTVASNMARASAAMGVPQRASFAPIKYMISNGEP